MDDRLFTRKVWKPEKGEYLVEVENSSRMVVDTPYGKRRAVFIKVSDLPYVWFINHYGRMVEKSIESQLESILPKSGKGTVKVIVGEADGSKTFDLEEVESSPHSMVVSVGVYVSDGLDDYHLVHSDTIPLGGEK